MSQPNFAEIGALLCATDRIGGNKQFHQRLVKLVRHNWPKSRNLPQRVVLSETCGPIMNKWDSIGDNDKVWPEALRVKLNYVYSGHGNSSIPAFLEWLWTHELKMYEEFLRELNAVARGNCVEYEFNSLADRKEDEHFLLDYVPDESRYSATGATAYAIRLIGAAGEMFVPDDVIVKICDKKYEFPSKFLNRRSIIEERMKGTIHFDGPNTRLAHYSYIVDNVVSEQKRIILHLDEVRWFSYSAIRDWSDELIRFYQESSLHTDRKSYLDELFSWINIPEIANEGAIDRLNTHNIFDTATTLVTSDGWVAYSIRGKDVNHFSGNATSAVAENIHTARDFTFDVDKNKEMPAPYRAAIRGVGEELSPLLRADIESQLSNIWLTGLSFELHAFHPDALFVFASKRTKEEVLHFLRIAPGKDYKEGRLHWVELNDDKGIKEAVSSREWTGAGMASLTRLLEITSSWQASQKAPSRSSTLSGFFEQKTFANG